MTHQKSTLRTTKSISLQPKNSRVLLKASSPLNKVGNALSHNFILQSSMYAAKVKGSLGMSKLMASLSWRKVSSKIMKVCSNIYRNRVSKGENKNENKTHSYIHMSEWARPIERPTDQYSNHLILEAGNVFAVAINCNFSKLSFGVIELTV